MIGQIVLRAETLDRVRELRRQYVRERSLFIGGEKMGQLLGLLGADLADLPALQATSNQLGDDPTLPFRRSRNGRFHIDTVGGRVRRLEFQPFVLSADEDFVRHDSGELRRFAEIPAEVQANSVFQALFRFKALIIEGVEFTPRPQLDHGDPNWICTLFHLRTITTPDLLGEPALEGVHSDGVDHTMTTYLGSTNMTDDSAVTYLHDMAEVNATRWDHVDQDLVVGSYQHRHPLDTVMIVDHERKHSLSPVIAVDHSLDATRDMLVFFTRKPARPGHVSRAYDSTTPHPTLPQEFALAIA